DQRVEGRVAGVAAVPVGVAVDFDRLEHEGQAGGRQQGIDRKRVAIEDLGLAGAHRGGRDEELDSALLVELTQGGDRYVALQHRAQRVDVERVEQIGAE